MVPEKMETLAQAFIRAAGADEEAMLMKPGAAGLHVLLANTYFPVDFEELQELYDKETFTGDTSFTWENFTVFATKLGWEAELEEKKHADATFVCIVDERMERLQFPLMLPDEMIVPLEPEEAEDIIGIGKVLNASVVQGAVVREWGKYKQEQKGSSAGATFGTWVRQYY